MSFLRYDIKRKPSKRALEWMQAAIEEADRIHTPEQIAAAEALLARTPLDIQPELELKAA